MEVDQRYRQGRSRAALAPVAVVGIVVDTVVGTVGTVCTVDTADTACQQRSTVGSPPEERWRQAGM